MSSFGPVCQGPALEEMNFGGKEVQNLMLSSCCGATNFNGFAPLANAYSLKRHLRV
jgi:hypothetical protein